jgi:TPR repeat protein
LVWFFLLFLALLGPVSAWAQDELSPDRADDTIARLRLKCGIGLCPYAPEIWKTFRDAMGGSAADQYMLGIYLMTGDKVRRDSHGGMRWLGLAAEHGYARAALELNRLRRGGADMDVDEARIAAVMRAKSDAGDADAMRALADMYLYGRGVTRDPNEGLRLFRAAAMTGSGEAEQDLATLLLRGGPGVAADRAEALRLLASAGRRGNTPAMLSLSYVLLTPPSGAESQPLEGYRWLMRAALLGDPDAQERLSQMLAVGLDDRGHAVKPIYGDPTGVSAASPTGDEVRREAMRKLAGAGMPPEMRERLAKMTGPPAAAPQTVVAPDLVQADKWFRLAARDPWHDNPQVRGMIEPKMTSAQLEEARKLVAAWHVLSLPEVMAMEISP